MVTLHELCHAVDIQQGWSEQAPQEWEYDPPRPDRPGDPTLEAFADTCEFGPLDVQLVGPSCEDDTEGAEALQILQGVFPHSVPGLGTTDLTWVEVAAYDFGEEVQGLAVIPTSDQLGLRIDAKTETGSQMVFVSLFTGDLSQVSPLEERVSPKGIPYTWRPARWAAAHEDQSMYVGRLTTPTGGKVKRLLLTDETSTASLGCTRHRERPFWSDGSFWSAYADDTVVRWGRWE